MVQINKTLETTQIRAVLSAYLILAGFWFVMAIAYIFPINKFFCNGWQPVLLGICIGLCWTVWLYGFRISIIDGRLEYRNGMYRTYSIQLADISEIRHSWVEWKLLGRAIRIPRLVITRHDGKEVIEINPKPFGRKDLQTIMRIIRKK